MHEEVELTNEDLKVLLNIVDVASQKGIFQGRDLAHIGHIYNKLAYLIQEAEQAKQPTKEGDE